MELQPPAEEVRAQLEKIAASPGFAGAGRLAPFLRHLVESFLAGRTDGLKESVLGVEVFQRGADFDPRTDPIVRVEARRLRSRLDEYYIGPGADDALRISLPKGGYVPEFARLGAQRPVAGTPRRRWLLWAGAAAAVPCAAGLGWWTWKRTRPVVEPRIAVLPFVNLSNDKGNEYLSDGLTEELIDRLAKVPGLKVASRGMVFQFKGARTDIREIAASLGATSIVEGSVRSQNRRVKISARLVDAVEGNPIWSNTYDRQMEDIFELQEELASAIANALRVELGRVGERVRPSISLEAYNHHLQARYQMNLYSVDGFRLALTHLQKCLELAPDYVPALADSSVTYTLLGYYGAMPDDIAWPRAKSLADRAITLDPKLAEAWSARGLEAGFHRWAWDEAKAACERAIELNPASALAHSQYALAYLLPVGRVDEAIRKFEKAIALDPLFSVAQYVLGFSYLSAGRFEDAVRQYARTIELGSPHPDVYWDYGMALGYLGRHGEARKAFEKKRFLSGQDPQDIGGLEAWFSGDLVKARRDATAVERLGSQGREDAMDLARYYSVIGNPEKAVEWLEIGLVRRERQMQWILVDPRLAAIRGEERYKTVARKMGLMK